MNSISTSDSVDVMLRLWISYARLASDAVYITIRSSIRHGAL